MFDYFYCLYYNIYKYNRRWWRAVKTKFNYTQIIAFGFLGIILLGTLLLCLPISVKDGIDITFLDAMFVATSATCVTGLVVVDTYTTWSTFGQLVIPCLIQIGGLGFMTLITMVFTFMKRKIGLRERKLLMQSAGTIRLSGIVKLIRRIVAGTFIFELLGAILIAVSLYSELGLGRSIYYGVFHSVSAFCNAGFDLFGSKSVFSSLTYFTDNYLLNITVMFLIVTGGLGFIVWEDIYNHRFKFSKYSLHSKILLTFTLILIFCGAAAFFVFEYTHSLKGLPFGEKILASFFQSITPRTAGFNTVNLTSMSPGGKFLMMLLMFIGGGSGSTAGGIKVTTFAVLVLTVISAARRNDNITAFKRRLSDDALKQAASIILVYGFMIIVSFFLMDLFENFTAGDMMFELISAVGTVGVTMGITPMLGTVSKIVVMILMFSGRIGGLTFMLLLAEKKVNVKLERPIEKIIIG